MSHLKIIAIMAGAAVSGALAGLAVLRMTQADRQHPAATYAGRGHVPNLSALRALPVPTGWTTVEVDGFAEAGDQGGGTFVYDRSSTAADDGALVVAPARPGGRWLRAREGGATVNVRWFGAKGNGLADDSAAIQAAISHLGSGRTRGSLRIPAGAYRITHSLELNLGGRVSARPLIITGDGQATQILNRCGPISPSFVIKGAGYWELHDLLLTGDHSHPNDGILVAKDTGGQQAGRFLIERVVCQMPGRGFVLRDTNTGVLRDCKAWPSGNGAGPSIAETVNAHQIGEGILMTGEFCNDISIYDFDCQPSDRYAPRMAAIRCEARVSSGIRIHGGVLEGEGAEGNRSSIELQNCVAFIISGVFAENSWFRFANCRAGVIEACDKGGNGGTSFTGACVRCTMLGCGDDSVEIGPSCERIVVINSDFDRAEHAIRDEGKNTIFISVSDQGALKPNQGMLPPSPAK